MLDDVTITSVYYIAKEGKTSRVSIIECKLHAKANGTRLAYDRSFNQTFRSYPPYTPLLIQGVPFLSAGEY